MWDGYVKTAYFKMRFNRKLHKMLVLFTACGEWRSADTVKSRQCAVFMATNGGGILNRGGEMMTPFGIHSKTSQHSDLCDLTRNQSKAGRGGSSGSKHI